MANFILDDVDDDEENWRGMISQTIEKILALSNDSIENESEKNKVCVDLGDVLFYLDEEEKQYLDYDEEIKGRTIPLWHELRSTLYPDEISQNEGDHFQKVLDKVLKKIKQNKLKAVVTKKLHSIFGQTNPNGLKIVLDYLALEDEKYAKEECPRIAAGWEILAAALESEEQFIHRYSALKRESIKDRIRRKLIALFSNTNPEGYSRVMWYLEREITSYEDQLPPVWKTLNAVVNQSDVIFMKYAHRIIEDTKEVENDKNFRSTMDFIYSNMAKPNDERFSSRAQQGLDFMRKADTGVSIVSAVIGFVRSFSLMDPALQSQIVKFLPRIISGQSICNSADEVAGALLGQSAALATMGIISCAWWGCSAIKNVHQWWKGDISGIRCTKNIIDSTFAIGGGIVGSFVGAFLGSVLGPGGTFGGGIAFGIIFSHFASVASDYLTQKIFGIPKEKSLENAYNFFGLKHTCSNNELNAAYRRLCLKHHPDKGGCEKDFCEVQLQMGVIKTARGQFDDIASGKQTFFDKFIDVFKSIFNFFRSSKDKTLLMITF